MSASVAVLIPVLARPHRAAPVVASIAAASLPNTFPVFICSPGDDAEIAACLETGAEVVVASFSPGPGDYARKINLGARSVAAEWYFTGADDLEFTVGWDGACLDAAHRRWEPAPSGLTGLYGIWQEQPVALVVGTNDDCNPLTADGRHSTHSLVHSLWMEQGTVDEHGVILHEGYDHQYVDTELVATARARGVWTHVPHAVVRHLHPMRRRSAMDDTYRKGQKAAQADARLFRKRRPLWERRPA